MILVILGLLSSPLLFIISYGYIHGPEKLLHNQRWIFVCFFLMPFSVPFELFLSFRNWLTFKWNSAPRSHRKKVEKISSDIKKWNCEGRLTKLCTARPGWLTVSLRVGAYFGILLLFDRRALNKRVVDLKTNNM